MSKTYDFGQEFEAMVIRLCLLEPSFIPAHQDVIDPGFFTEPTAMEIVGHLMAYWGKYHSVPNQQSFKLYLKGEEKKPQRLVKYVDACLEGGHSDFAYIKERIVDFARCRAIEDALVDCSDLVTRGEFKEIRQRMSQSLNVGKGDLRHGYNYFDTLVQRFKMYGAAPQETGSVATGIRSLDENLDGGGLWSGELGLIQAPPEGGKTAMLVNLGYGALLQGLNVTHFTLEVSATKLARRYDMRISQMTKQQLFQKKRTAATKIMKMAKKLKCGLDLKQFGTKIATVRDLRAYLQIGEETRSFRPDLLIVDYGEILAPEFRRDDRWIEIEESYEALRALAVEWRCPLWTGSQTNRSGLSARTSDMRHTGGSFGKNKTADVIISLNPEPRARDTIPLRLYGVKNREEKSGWEVTVNFTRSTQTIKED